VQPFGAIRALFSGFTQHDDVHALALADNEVSLAIEGDHLIFTQCLNDVRLSLETDALVVVIVVDIKEIFESFDFSWCQGESSGCRGDGAVVMEKSGFLKAKGALLILDMVDP